MKWLNTILNMICNHGLYFIKKINTITIRNLLWLLKAIKNRYAIQICKPYLILGFYLITCLSKHY